MNNLKQTANQIHRKFSFKCNLVPRVFSPFDMKEGAKKDFSSKRSFISKSEKTLGTRVALNVLGHVVWSKKLITYAFFGLKLNLLGGYIPFLASVVMKLWSY